MNDHDIDELMRGEAAHAPVGDGGDLRRGRARLRRQRVLAGAGGTGVAALALAIGSVVVPRGDGPDASHRPADIERNPDGSVTATIYRLDDVDGLETQLRRIGIPTEADYAPLHKECEQPRFTPASNDVEVIGSIGYPADEQGDNTEYWIRLYPDELRPGQTVVIEIARIWTQPPDDTGVALWSGAGVANGPVEPCHLVEDEDGYAPRFPHSEKWWDVMSSPTRDDYYGKVSPGVA